MNSTLAPVSTGTVADPLPTATSKEANDPKRGQSTQHKVRSGMDSFGTIMSRGGKIMDYKPFRTYSVWVRMPDGHIEHRWNISEERLQKCRQFITKAADFDPQNEKRQGRKRVEDPTFASPPTKSPTSSALESCCAGGGVIVHYEPHVFYSAHVRRPDGRIENFNRVAAQQFDKFQHEEGRVGKTKSGGTPVPLTTSTSIEPYVAAGTRLTATKPQESEGIDFIAPSVSTPTSKKRKREVHAPATSSAKSVHNNSKKQVTTQACAASHNALVYNSRPRPLPSPIHQAFLPPLIQSPRSLSYAPPTASTSPLSILYPHSQTPQTPSTWPPSYPADHMHTMNEYYLSGSHPSR
ncbi:hypothetical protein HDV00_008134 [Rhizophlyctis rosea]|nr:hypothetical protein HDV00_008134 [Rhizophlyctis rosea]